MQNIVASAVSGGEPFHKPPMASGEGCTVAGAQAALDAAGFFPQCECGYIFLDNKEHKQTFERVFANTLNIKIREWGKKSMKNRANLLASLI